MGLEMARDVCMDPADRRKIVREFDRSGGITDLEIRLKRRDGALVWVQTDSRTVKDPTGKVLRYEIFVLDVTDRRRAEEALRTSEARKRAVLEASLDSVITIDEDGAVIEVNPAAERTFGRSRGGDAGPRPRGADHSACAAGGASEGAGTTPAERRSQDSRKDSPDAGPPARRGGVPRRAVHLARRGRGRPALHRLHSRSHRAEESREGHAPERRAFPPPLRIQCDRSRGRRPRRRAGRGQRRVPRDAGLHSGGLPLRNRTVERFHVPGVPRRRRGGSRGASADRSLSSLAEGDAAQGRDPRPGPARCRHTRGFGRSQLHRLRGRSLEIAGSSRSSSGRRRRWRRSGSSPAAWRTTSTIC